MNRNTIKHSALQMERPWTGVAMTKPAVMLVLPETVVFTRLCSSKPSLPGIREQARFLPFQKSLTGDQNSALGLCCVCVIRRKKQQGPLLMLHKARASGGPPLLQTTDDMTTCFAGSQGLQYPCENPDLWPVSTVSEGQRQLGLNGPVAELSTSLWLASLDFQLKPCNRSSGKTYALAPGTHRELNYSKKQRSGNP